MQILDHGVEVEALEFPGIVERFAHRIGGGRVRMEHADIEVLWPPVAIPVSAGASSERALAGAVVSLCVHVFLRSFSLIFFELFCCRTITTSGSRCRRDPGCLPRGRQERLEAK